MKIPFFDYKKLYLKDKSILNKIFKDVSSKGAFILQEEVSDFEKKITKFTRSKYAIAVANGTDAMQIYLKAYDIKKNDEIIISSHTMIATASAVKFCGAKPIPVDINWNDGLIDPIEIEKKINSKTKAILITHLNGRTCDMDRILKIKKKYNLLLFEDAAQGLGSKYKNKFAGTFGEASSISFYPAKILGCLGDGGIILTNNKKYYNKMKLLRDHGRNSKGNIVYWGYNSRLDNIQAGFLNYFFTKFTNTVKRRREIAKIYNDELSNISQLRLPPFNIEKNINFDTFQNYEILAKNRDKLKKYLFSKGVGTIVQWNGIATNKLRKLGIFFNLKNSDMMFKELLMLPMNIFLTDNEVKYITKLIKKFYKIK